MNTTNTSITNMIKINVTIF